MTTNAAVWLVGSDTGGTFTDLVAADGTVTKVPSTPANPAVAVADGLVELAVDGLVGAPGGAVVLSHGTTVATNAVLERGGGPVALVTTEGFADVIEIGRQDRPSLYDTSVDRPAPLVARHLRFEVRERLAADGSVVTPLDSGVLDAVVAQLVAAHASGEVAAVAVCLLHADLNPVHEQQVAGAIRGAGIDVTCSHEVSPEFREFERTATTVVNAYLRPVCAPYVSSLAASVASLGVLTSAGGLADPAAASATPARLVLSGPAGGVAAAAAAAVANAMADAVTFDMGGTSTDVCLILGGQPAPAAQRSVDGLVVRVPSLDVHTIGAGGGSIAAMDPGGALVVGPRSAGAVPGPACYGRGGTHPTVTDANVVLGRIPADATLPGIGRLDADAARVALAAAGVDAAGVIAVVNAAMEQALRAVTVERGVDPGTLTLVAFGGAGGLHCCELADAVGMSRVLVPARAGVLSAVGVLTAPRRHDVVRSWPTPGNHDGVVDAASDLVAEAAGVLGVVPGQAGVEVTVGFDCRYRGQSHELTVADVASFAAEHERRNGYRRTGAPVEVVAVRAAVSVAAGVDVADLPDPPRPVGVGPRVLAEPDCTIWLPPGWQARPGAAGALVLERTAGGQR